MLFQVGESAKQGAIVEASGIAVAADTVVLTQASGLADAAQAAAETYASGVATTAESNANAYTDSQLAGIDLDEIAELTSEIGMLDDTVTVNPASGNFDLSNVIPVGAAIISVQVRLDTAITGAGGATKVGIGTAADPDKYGKTSSLASGQLINTIPAWVALGGSEDIRIFAVDNGGVAAGTIGGVGQVVRVRVIYTQTVALP